MSNPVYTEAPPADFRVYPALGFDEETTMWSFTLDAEPYAGRALGAGPAVERALRQQAFDSYLVARLGSKAAAMEVSTAALISMLEPHPDWGLGEG